MRAGVATVPDVRRGSSAGSSSALTGVGSVVRRMPGVRLVREYRSQQFLPDLWAAVAVTALMVPHGMAYAELAGVPAAVSYTHLTLPTS